MFVSVDLPIPGEPPSRTSEPGHETAAQDHVELADPRAQARRALGADLAQRDRPRDRAGGARGAGTAAGGALLGQRVPLAARRALAVPFGRLGSARGAGEHGGRLGHLRRVGRGPVASAPAGGVRVALVVA